VRRRGKPPGRSRERPGSEGGNAANPRIGSGMQQARVSRAEETVEVVRNHEDGTRRSRWFLEPEACAAQAVPAGVDEREQVDGGAITVDAARAEATHDPREATRGEPATVHPDQGGACTLRRGSGEDGEDRRTVRIRDVGPSFDTSPVSEGPRRDPPRSWRAASPRARPHAPQLEPLQGRPPKRRQPTKQNPRDREISGVSAFIPCLCPCLCPCLRRKPPAMAARIGSADCDVATWGGPPCASVTARSEHADVSVAGSLPRRCRAAGHGQRQRQRHGKKETAPGRLSRGPSLPLPTVP
jgi:hypothetical protein